MNEDISISQNSLRLLYYRYKDTSYYVLATLLFIIIASIGIFFQVVLPQLQNWFSISDEVVATRGRIEVINRNISFLNNVDKSLLNKQVNTATTALPLEKNFGAIVGALSDAAVQSGVSLDDYTFQVGNIASVSGQQVGIEKDLSTVKLSVTINGGPDAVGIFIKNIEEKLPLSEVTDVDGDVASTTITLQFYQKEFPHITFKDDQPLLPLSDKNAALLHKLGDWQPQEQQADVGSEASGSGIPLF